MSSSGSTCADYVSKAYCTADGGYGSGWDDSCTFDDWAVNGVAATVACCGCGGGSTVTGKQACQGHSYDNATCEAVGCCRWNVLLGCRANDGDALCYSGNPCDTLMTMPLAKRWDAAAGTFSLAAVQMMGMHYATLAIHVTPLCPQDRLHRGLARKAR